MTRRRCLSRLVVVGLLTLATSRCGTVSAQTEPQRTPPQRIVSLIPAVTEMLVAIGAAPRVVGVGSFGRVPESMRDVDRVGGLVDPDVERILTLRPDLVILYATQADLRAQLDRASVPILPYAHSGLPDVTDTLRMLGRVTGDEGRAIDLAERIEAQLAEIRQRVRGRVRPRTMIVIEREPRTLRGLYASGGTGFLHDMLEAAGGQNVFEDVGRAAVQVTTEVLLTAAPEVIVELRIGTRRLSPDEQALERQAWNAVSAVPAVRTGRVHLLDSDDLVVPGPRVADGTDQLARLLQPLAFAPPDDRGPAGGYEPGVNPR